MILVRPLLRRRAHRRVRAAGLVCAGAVMALAPFSARGDGAAGTQALPLDRMEYVVDAPADPYTNDPSTIHVGLAASTVAGQPQRDYARSFVHVALDRLPDGALVGGVTVTLPVTRSAEASKNGVYQTYNVRPSEALLQACVLTEPLPASKPTAETQPAFDCQHGSAVGKPLLAPDGTTIDAFTFDLAPLVKAWAAAGNTGAAIVPISSETGNAWAISFTKGRSTAAATYRLPPAPPPPPGPRPKAPTYYRVPVTVTKPYPFPTAPPQPVASASPAPQAGVPETIIRTVPGAKPRAWTWVLPACIAAAGLLTAVGRRGGLRRRGGPLKLRVLMDMRTHPRSYAVAAVVAAWGLLFASYSVVVTPPSRQVAAPGVAPGSVSPGAGSQSVSAPSAAPGVPGASTTYRTVRGATTFNPGNEFAGPGSYRTIGNIPVFFPQNGPPVAQLYSGADNLTGIDYASKTIKLCGHAALTFGPAFNIGASDLNVFWSYLNKRGGINGWKFDVTWGDDGYDAGKAVQAAQSCKDGGAFMTLGGIGFDQIPAVRQWAEANRELYLHHIVTTAGSQGLRYSFTSLPSEEQMGILAGQLAVKKFAGKRIGIMWRDSPNWESGHDLFVKIVRECGCGITIVGDHKVALSQGNYTTEIGTLKNTEKAEVVFAWENALSTTEMIQQAQGQQYWPDWIVFPFNLELDALGATALDQGLYGIAAWDAYNPGSYSGPYAEYANLIKEFEEQYRSEGNAGPSNTKGNDLLFLAWEGFKGLADLFSDCLPTCTRNRMAAVLLTYHKKLPGFCDADFTRGDGHHGGWRGSFFEAFRDPRDGHAAWRPFDRCRSVG